MLQAHHSPRKCERKFQKSWQNSTEDERNDEKKNEMIEESGERGFPVRLYRRKPSTAKKVLNYFVQAHLQDK